MLLELQCNNFVSSDSTVLDIGLRLEATNHLWWVRSIAFVSLYLLLLYEKYLSHGLYSISCSKTSGSYCLVITDVLLRLQCNFSTMPPCGAVMLVQSFLFWTMEIHSCTDDGETFVAIYFFVLTDYGDYLCCSACLKLEKVMKLPCWTCTVRHLIQSYTTRGLLIITWDKKTIMCTDDWKTMFWSLRWSARLGV